MSKDDYCSDHDFWWDIDDDMGCPVCYGYNIGYKDGYDDKMSRSETEKSNVRS